MSDQSKGSGDTPLVIWRLLDGKAGHENQSRGLCNALAAHLSVESIDIPVRSRWHQCLEVLTRRFSQGAGLAPPDLILGAGHSTHLAMLAARRRYGGRTVVLMAPSLPRGFFDLCLVPQHDEISGPNVLQTRGALNRVQPQPTDPNGPVLILLGGPSRHYHWQDGAVLEQVQAIAQHHADLPCLLADSRRTPRPLISRLQQAKPDNLTLVPWQETGAGWLADQLHKSRAVWVSEDSVSMVYESLTSGLAVGLIELDAEANSRVAEGMRQLKREGLVTPFESWRETKVVTPPGEPFNEAARCAEWMVKQWL